MDVETKAFFKTLLESDVCNKTCSDCQAPHPQWASISYGTFFCLTCSGQHRSLGVHLSFVRSISMDSWNEKQKKMMELGGNAEFIKFCKQQGIHDMKISDKYNTKAAEWYRNKIRALYDGTTVPAPLPVGQGALPAAGSAPFSSARTSSTPPQSEYSAMSGPSGVGSNSGGYGGGPGGFGGMGSNHGGSSHSGGGSKFNSDGLQDKFWGAMSFAGKIANQAKETVQKEGLYDSLAIGATYAGQKASEASTWAADKGTEYYGMYGGNSGPSRGDQVADKLRGLNTGAMGGFGSDCMPQSMPERTTPSPAFSDPIKPAVITPVPASVKEAAPAPKPVPTPTPAPAPKAAAKKDWDNDDWFNDM